MTLGLTKIYNSLGYRSGVTVGISSPKHRGFFSGLGTAFSLGARHKLEEGAIVQDVTAVHVSVRHFDGVPSISTQISILRQLLLGESGAQMAEEFRAVAKVSKASS